MRIKQIFAMTLFLLMGVVVSSMAQEQHTTVLDQVKWQRGPCISDLGNEAQIRVPAGYVFANGSDTRMLMEAMHNIPSKNEVGFIAPTTLEWFLVFDFADSGYVKDDEKSSLDADAMLKSLKSANEEVNKVKKERGWETFEFTGWQLPPRYNSETHNLEWATKFNDKKGTTINWNTRLLGRNGVMSVTLVTSEDKLQDILPQFNSVLDGFSYKPGHRYADFHQGDKVAEFGLAALVLGGAAVAAKAGIFGALWKIITVIFASCWKAIAVGFVAMTGFFINLFKKKDK